MLRIFLQSHLTHREQIKMVNDFSWLKLERLDGIEEVVNEILSHSI